MEEEAEASYSEIVELSTFPKQNSGVLLKPSSLSSPTELETYINMDATRDKQTPEMLNYLKPTLRQGTIQNCPTTYKRASEIEDMSCLQYENITSTISERFASTDRITSTDSLRKSEFEHSLELCKRLDFRRSRMQFYEFACYAMEAVFLEVEKVAFLDFIYLIFSLGILALGFVHLDDCKVCTKIPVMMVCCGVMDSVANLVSFVAAVKFYGKRGYCCRDVVRAMRAVLFLAHLYGLVLVYGILPPVESDRKSERYCESYTYWLSFSYFHLFTLTSITTVLAMLIAATSYYL